MVLQLLWLLAACVTSLGAGARSRADVQSTRAEGPEVDYWPAFARWWSSRRQLVGPQGERTDVLWIQADQQSGLQDVPYYWAGVFVLEAARFLYPRGPYMAPIRAKHFGTSNAGPSAPKNMRWPKRAHPGALTTAGQERTPCY